MMTLQSFLEHLNKKKTVPLASVIYFFGKEYPLLFFCHIISYLRNYVVIKSFDMVGVELSLIKAHLSTMSFDGQTIYWLNGFHDLSAKKQQEFINYAHSYDGPHVLLFFSTQESLMASVDTNKQNICITIPDGISAHDFPLIRFLLNDELKSEKTQFLSRIVSYTPQISLDNACLFAHYEVVVGKNIDDFFKEWVAHIIEPTHSLFLLSQYFFGKKSKLFFEHWSHCIDVYMPPFWASFWADQIWRAYIYCDFMKQKDYAQAKKAQYKLPFSLINRDWSSLNLSELRNAHHFLSRMDFRLKNGGSPVALELFYSLFFENKFR